MQGLPHDASLAIVPNLFHLTLVHNTGIAFGLFRQHQSILLGLISMSLILLLVWARKLEHSPRMARLGFALILGGAIGNWLDRVRFGAVIDFLDFRVWPVFNLADSAISIGVGLYVLLIFQKRNPHTS